MKYLSILILFVSMYSHSEITTIAEAINKAGAQRMLSQRIVKDYIMVGSGVKAMYAQKELDQSIALFEQQHLELMDFSPSDSITQALSKVSAVWMTFRLKAISRPSRQETMVLIPLSDELFVQSNNVVSLLEKETNVSSALLVNTAGKQRMLSQKMAKLYMAMAWHVDLGTIKSDFTQTLADYEAGLVSLTNEKNNTKEIKKKLAKVTAQWEFSKAGFSQYEQNRFVPTLISVTTESMLKKMDELTRDYQDLADK